MEEFKTMARNNAVSLHNLFPKTSFSEVLKIDMATELSPDSNYDTVVELGYFIAEIQRIYTKDINNKLEQERKAQEAMVRSQIDVEKINTQEDIAEMKNDTTLDRMAQQKEMQLRAMANKNSS